jgi:hypothetical protein
MTPEHETAHFAHRTGHRWLDLTLALCAKFATKLPPAASSARLVVRADPA